MKKYDLYIFFLGLITGIFLTVIIAICYNNYYNQESWLDYIRTMT